MLQVAPICELLSMASIVFFRKVVLESVDSARARVEEYQQLRDQLGWNDEHLVVCLDARAKATLVYLAQVCLHAFSDTAVNAPRLMSMLAGRRNLHLHLHLTRGHQDVRLATVMFAVHPRQSNARHAWPACSCRLPLMTLSRRSYMPSTGSRLRNCFSIIMSGARSSTAGVIWR